MRSSYDIIVIGGGATGSGIALDASLRGYKTLLIEKDDFASKTSSNSTKLIHGGVRYLEKAILQFDKDQLNLVKEALKERYYFLHNAQNITQKINLISPFYHWYELFYIYFGLKIYDFLSFSKSLGKSLFLDKLKTKLILPHLSSKLFGSVSYFDGSFNDSKMVIALLQTAQENGCDILNYHEVKHFLYTNNTISGVEILDTINNTNYKVNAKVVINATGYFCDKIRQLDDKTCKDIVTFSKGSHIILDKKYTQHNQGILFQKTSDKRVLFMLPFNEYTLAGTTEVVTSFDANPQITKEEIKYLLSNINTYLNIQLTHKDILSSFSGIRPLLKNEKTDDTANIVREHIILKSSSNLVSITGGKWTTYRKMAEDCLDFIIKNKLLPYQNSCNTHFYKLNGNEQRVRIEQLAQYNISKKTKIHLIQSYGQNSVKLLDEFNTKELRASFDTKYPYIKAELLYALKYEYVKKPNDFLFRRIGIGKMNLNTTKLLLSKIVNIMSKSLHWSNEQTLFEYQSALKEINEFLQTIKK